jgi:Cu(I)/Ag(I) efflux system membrane fusion protein/cobalt-zinc-cadmium efflux system membrane fusion protein
MVNLKFDGWIEDLFVAKTGEHVEKGQPLLSIYSPQLVTTQEEYLLAYQNYKKLSESTITEIGHSATDLLNASRRRLQYWDISDSQIRELESTGEVKKNLTIYAPVSGVVRHKNAVEGAGVTSGSDLFSIANLDTIWVLAHIFEYELPWIEVGQPATVELPYIPGKKFRGEVDYVYPYLDEKTRDIKIRIVFSNPLMELKPQMYASVTISAQAEKKQLVVPSEAVIRTGERNIVFLAGGDGKFKPREVILGPEGQDGLVAVMFGLSEADIIVTSGQFLLDSESRLQEAIQKMLEPDAVNK